VRVFLSYRRDDTAGRAGRIADVFAARYGERNVFHDVDAAAPGLDFAERVDAAIVASDVMLVVIGRGWLTSTGDGGGRRIDRPDDFVRREVGAALDADIRVVPVLVDDAELPTSDQLPSELAGMLRRQAVSVRDSSWRQDVDDLIRRLEDEDREPLAARRPRWLFALGAVALLIVVVAVVVALTRDDPDGGSSSDAELGPCSAIDDSWTTAEIVRADPVEVRDDDGALAQVQVVGASTRFVSGNGDVLVMLDVQNVSDEAEGTVDEMYMGAGAIGGLLVDGIALPSIGCLSVSGDPQMEPGERVIATVGFQTDVDPAAASLTLEAFRELNLPVTSGG
jgi:TIR domain